MDGGGGGERGGKEKGGRGKGEKRRGEEEGMGEKVKNQTKKGVDTSIKKMIEKVPTDYDCWKHGCFLLYIWKIDG